VIVFSGSDPVILASAGSIALAPCVNGVAFSPPSASLDFTITDVNGNIMPAGTTVSFSTTNGTIVSSPTSFVVPNSIACLNGAGPGPGFICPAGSAVALGASPLGYTVTVKSDATQDNTTLACSNTRPDGVLTVIVTTPKGVTATAQLPVTD
jgi:hypothetical protein